MFSDKLSDDLFHRFFQLDNYGGNILHNVLHSVWKVEHWTFSSELKQITPYEGVTSLIHCEDVTFSRVVWNKHRFRVGINLMPEEMENELHCRIKFDSVIQELANSLARKMLIYYAYKYFKTRREFWNTFLTLCAAQRDESCIDTFGTLPTEILAYISIESETQTICGIMGMELMYGIPFLASRLEIEKMFYSSNLGYSITPIIEPFNRYIVHCNVEMFTPKTMEDHRRIEKIYK